MLLDIIEFVIIRWVCSKFLFCYLAASNIDSSISPAFIASRCEHFDNDDQYYGPMVSIFTVLLRRRRRGIIASNNTTNARPSNFMQHLQHRCLEDRFLPQQKGQRHCRSNTDFSTSILTLRLGDSNQLLPETESTGPPRNRRPSDHHERQSPARKHFLVRLVYALGHLSKPPLSSVNGFPKKLAALELLDLLPRA